MTVGGPSPSPPSKSGRPHRRRRKVALAVTLLTLAVEIAAVARRGYGIGGRIVVRCRQGHLFTTIWIPGGSLKALRLGLTRVQHCPVGHHWSIVAPVRTTDLSGEERASAREHRDVPVP